jgi:SdrD B-like protein
MPNPGLDQFSPKDSAADDLTDSDINPTGTDFGFTSIYTFGSNLISITTIDAGIIVYQPPTPTRTPTPIHIGNFVWHDLDGNGVQDPGEPGVGGVVVQFWNAAKNDLIATTATNGNGLYALVAPVPGDYRIRVIPPSGASFTLKDQGADTTDSVSIASARTPASPMRSILPRTLSRSPRRTPGWSTFSQPRRPRTRRRRRPQTRRRQHPRTRRR